MSFHFRLVVDKSALACVDPCMSSKLRFDRLKILDDGAHVFDTKERHDTKSLPDLRNVANDLKPDICMGIDDEELGTLSRPLSAGTKFRLEFHADEVIIPFSHRNLVVKR